MALIPICVRNLMDLGYRIDVNNEYSNIRVSWAY